MASQTHPSCYHVGYSLSCVEYDDLRNLANGRCSLCRTTPERFEIDHDHGLGQWAVRGLLCGPCNHHLKMVDDGRIQPGTQALNYLANAWHKQQTSSAAKAARVRPKTDCPTCGRFTSIHQNGRLHRHWSRLSGQSNEICPGD